MYQPDPRKQSRDWIADAVQHRGILGALGYYWGAAMEFLRDLTPQRRRSRYGDTDYDFDHGVDTTWATVSFRTRLREFTSGARYQASDPALFHEILGALPVSPEGFTFVDLGSGKGRTLLMASDYPFRKIIGVELLDELHEVARQNIANYRSDQQKCFDIEARCGDAREFQFPQQPLVLYLFNPFPDYVLHTVLDRLRLSAVSHPRDIYVIYHNLVHQDMFDARPWLQKMSSTHQYAIYKGR
jgi:SAM-dependent methyltransferase